MKVKYNPIWLIITMLFVLLLGGSSFNPAQAASAILEPLRTYIPVMDKNTGVTPSTAASTTLANVPILPAASILNAGSPSSASAPLEPIRIYISVMEKDASVVPTFGASTSTTTGSSSGSSAGTTGSSSASYAPQPGDSSLLRDKVFLNLSASKLLITSFTPVQVEAILVGNLPDPCHVLRVVVSSPDANNIIKLDVYSLVKPGTVCITVLKPFTVSVPLGSFSPGQYTVLVDGSKLGVFDTTAPVTLPNTQ